MLELLQELSTFINSGALQKITTDVPLAQASLTSAIDKTIDALNQWKAAIASITPIVQAVQSGNPQ